MSKINIKYKGYGAIREVTGSCHFLGINTAGKQYNLVIDCGAVQNQLKNMNELYEINSSFKNIDWKNIDAIFLTHAHLDHSGSLPIPFMQGYSGSIYSTAPSAELARLILTDSAFIQNKECEKYNLTKEGKRKPIYPIYGQRHVEQTMDRFRGYDYNKPIVLNENITVWLKPAGHILGAASIYIEVRCEEETKRILFTGDTSADKKLPFTMLPDFRELKVDYLFTESTYGDRIHEVKNNTKVLKDAIEKTCIENKGQLMIPVFSIARSTSILAELKKVYRSNPDFKDIPIYLASPMSCKAHRIYGQEDSYNFYNKSDIRHKDLFEWEQVNYIEDYSEVENKILNDKPKIICVSAGMLSGGYSVAVAAHLIDKQKNKILFVGYQGYGTIGRKILESKYSEPILIDGKNVPRRCDVDFISMSSHADYIQLIEMFKTMRHTKIKKIFLIHGENNTLTFFKERLKENFVAEVIIPEKTKGYNL